MFSFEKLNVWQEAKELALNIYQISKKFPDTEKFGIIAQITRAAISIPSNIAEGSSRTSNRDRAHFSQLAYGSLMELCCQLIISRDLGFLDETHYKNLRCQIESIALKLSALRKSQLNKLNNS